MLGWIAAGIGGAIGAAAIASGLGLKPGEVVVPTSAALWMSVVFAFRPPAGIGAFLLLVLMAQTIQHWLGADFRFFDEISVALLVALSGAKNWSRILRLRPGWKEGAIGLAVLAGVLSSLVSAVPPDTWIPALLLLVKGVAFFYAVSWLRLDIGEVERVGAVLLLFSGLVLGLGLAEMVDPARFQQALGLPAFQEVRGGIGVIKSVFLHPAIFGWLTAYVSLFLYARFIVLREWWALAGALVLNLGTLLSGRRRPVIGVLSALSVGVLWVWRQRRSPRAMLHILAPLAVAVVVVAILSAPVLSGFYAGTVGEYLGAGDLAEILSPDPNEAVIAGSHPRLALYVGSLAVARDFFPLGAGLGRFGSYMSEAHYSPLYDRYGLDLVYGLNPQNPVAISDTFWPMVLAELGPVGLAGVAAFLGMLLFRLWRIAGETPSPPMRVLALGGLFVFVEGMVESLAAPTYVAPPIAYFVFGAAAVVNAVAGSQGRTGVVDDHDTRHTR